MARPRVDAGAVGSDAGAQPMWSDDVTRDPRLRVASLLAPAVLPAYAVAARRLGERLRRPIDLVVPSDYERCGADLDDVCFVCSVPYVLLEREGRIDMEIVAAPVLRGARYAGRPVYFSDVIVRADGPHRSFADLAGSRWAYNEPYSHSGFVVALHHLAQIGADASFIGSAVEAGYHDDAIGFVLEGRADWAAIDSQVLDLAFDRDPGLRDRLRVVAELGPSTIQPVVASRTRLGADERELVREVLCGLHADALAKPILAAAGIERLVPLVDADYVDIRTMLDRVIEARLLPSWWWTRWETTIGAGRG